MNILDFDVFVGLRISNFILLKNVSQFSYLENTLASLVKTVIFIYI